MSMLLSLMQQTGNNVVQEPDYRTTLEKFEIDTLIPILKVVSYSLITIGLCILFFYILRLIATTDYKKKYDFINENEINYLWYSALTLVIGLGFYVDTLDKLIATSLLWFIIKIFIIGLLSSIVGVIIYYSLKFYYPFFINQRLQNIRKKPRINPNTGAKMRLLSEEEEDEYLDEGMQAEEDAFSVDYDVWVDESENGNNYFIIEKYGGKDGKSSAAQLCPDCNYQTLKIVKTDVITAPTIETGGTIERFFKCSYCSYKIKDQAKLPKLKVE